MTEQKDRIYTQDDLEQEVEKLVLEKFADLFTKRQQLQPFFDIVILFSKDKEPQLLVDENVQLTIEGLLTEHNQIAVKTNWFSQDLTIHKLTENDFADITANASVASQEARTGTKGSKVQRHTGKSKTKP